MPELFLITKKEKKISFSPFSSIWLENHIIS